MQINVEVRYSGKETSRSAVVNVQEVTGADAPIAFIHPDGLRGDDIIYRYYDGACYIPALYQHYCCGKSGVLPVEHLHHYIRGEYAYWNYGFERNLEAFQESAASFLIVDGVVYEQVGEPRYVVQTFGLGHNHGGTGLLVDTAYNGNISKERYFSALQADEAVACANRIAAARGDTKSIGKFKATIEVLMPEAVRVDPQAQHGDGDPFINQMESVINNSEDANTAALMCAGAALVSASDETRDAVADWLLRGFCKAARETADERMIPFFPRKETE